MQTTINICHMHIIHCLLGLYLYVAFLHLYILILGPLSIDSTLNAIDCRFACETKCTYCL